jgi:Uma2 family endonuclease
MKLRVKEDNAFVYPDVFVTCADSDRGQSHSKSAPVLSVKVLSPVTSAFDRGAKFASYRKLPTLHEYALIDPERLSLDLFRREGDSKCWVPHPIDAGGQVEWASVGHQLPLETLYEDVTLLSRPQVG